MHWWGSTPGATAEGGAADLALLRAARRKRENGNTQLSFLHAASLPLESMVGSMTEMLTHYGLVPVASGVRRPASGVRRPASGVNLGREILRVPVIHVLPAGTARGADPLDARGIEDRPAPAQDAK
jgi:hypothetical protein